VADLPAGPRRRRGQEALPLLREDATTALTCADQDHQQENDKNKK
jgi:hypothetical protein